MESTRLSSKGQLIIPKAVRDAHGWQPGLEFIVIDSARGLLLIPRRQIEPTTLADVAGCLKFDGQAKTGEEIDEALRRGVREDWHDSN